MRKRRKKKNKKNKNELLLFKRGNYSLLRLLTLLSAAGPKGMPTSELLDKIGSRSTYTQNVIIRAYKQELIERKLGEKPGPGQFSPKYNIITTKGKRLLAKLT